MRPQSTFKPKNITINKYYVFISLLFLCVIPRGGPLTSIIIIVWKITL
ncbi:MAG: hypothetical protein LBC53_01860 [Spirochaetaceae bacterium]|nr:hypothetical protein [Spirochaetaceae bacterium]